MYFHVDESGNTGNNLFDANQPRLSYGVISSVTNADALCEPMFRSIRKKVGSELVHANELGVGGLTAISAELFQIQRKMGLDFDYFFVEKTAYALVSFFEAVFDAGLNKAVPWQTYWTPMRYLMIHKLAQLFDDELLRASWALCTATNVQQHADDIVLLLNEVKRRAVDSALDARTIEIIVDALNFGIAHPLVLDFGASNPLLVSPNAIGFQFVVSAIARRVRRKGRKVAASIVIDQQAQFNRVQIETHQFLRRFAEGFRMAPERDRQWYISHPMFVTLDKADVVHAGLPSTPITVSKSVSSIGLQIVDVYLWLANRVLDGALLSPELVQLWNLFAKRSIVDGISFEGMARRFSAFEQMLPEYSELTSVQLVAARANVDEHRRRVATLDI